VVDTGDCGRVPEGVVELQLDMNYRPKIDLKLHEIIYILTRLGFYVFITISTYIHSPFSDHSFKNILLQLFSALKKVQLVLAFAIYIFINFFTKMANS
jgi:hypothetical protein